MREDEGRVAAAAAAGFLLPSCCNGTRAGWDWSLIARGVVSRTRVGYIEIATNDRVRSCPGELARKPRLPQREEDPLLLTERGIKGERCLKPPSIYRAFRGVAWERIRIVDTWENRALFHDRAEKMRRYGRLQSLR